MRVTILFLLALSLLAFQPPSRPGPDKQKQTPEIEDLLLRVGALPVEMEADSLLMLIDSGKLNPASIPALLDDLFIRTVRISMPSTLRPVYYVLDDTSSGPGSYANASRILGLNQLTLQTRIISRLSQRNDPQVTNKFDMLRIPDPPQSCKDAFRPILTPYYTTLFDLYRKKITGANEKTAQELADWLLSHSRISQAGQIEPVSRLILKLSGNKDLYARAYSQFTQDLRTFTPIFSEYIHSLDDVSAAIIALAKSNDQLMESNEALWRAFMGYNQRALSGVRCSKMSSKEIDAAKTKLRTRLGGATLPPESAAELLELEKIEPKSSDDNAPELTTYRDDKTYVDLIWEDSATLRYGDEDRRKTFRTQKVRPDGLMQFIPLEERKSSAWLAQAQAYLRKIEDYRKQNEDEPIAHFSKVGELYSSIVEVVPPDSDLFAEALTSYLNFLSSSPILKQSPVLWYAQVKIMLRRATNDDHELGVKRMRNLIRSHGNQFLNTIADVDQFNPLNSNANMNVLFTN